MKKALLILGISLISFAVFAAVKTTFYGPVDMTNNRVMNVADPSAGKDAVNMNTMDARLVDKLSNTGGTMRANLNMGSHVIKNVAVGDINSAVNKGYVDITDSIVSNYAAIGIASVKTYAQTNLANKLSLGGGTMLGTINMNGRRLSNLPDPSEMHPSDAVPKKYVDSLISSSVKSGNSQYFALRKGSSYTPLYDLPFVTNMWQFEVVVLKAFNGYVIAAGEGFPDGTVCSNWYSSQRRSWKVGQTVNITFVPGSTFSETNGTMNVYAVNRSGVTLGLSNFGITFPIAPTLPEYRVYIGSALLNINTPYDMSNSPASTFVVGITNINNIASGACGFDPMKWYHYSSSIPQTVLADTDLNQNPPRYSSIFPINIPANGCVWVQVNLNGFNYNEGYGYKWSFKVDGLGSYLYQFGPLFIPGVE